MSQYKIITIADVEANMKRARDDIARMDKAVADCKYDSEDCCVSYHLQEVNVSVCEKQLKILKNGGVSTFIGYTDLDGNFLTEHTFKNKFGGQTTAFYNSVTNQTIYTSAKTVTGLLKKGIKKVEYEAPAWAKTYSGSMIGSFYASIYEAKYNRCTGDEQPRRIIRDYV